MLGLGSDALQWLAAGVVVTVLGGLIKFAGWTWLLAGYDEPTSSVPDDVVRDIAGNSLLRVGIALLAVGVLAAVRALPSSVSLILVVAIALAVARLIYRLNTWTPPEEI